MRLFTCPSLLPTAVVFAASALLLPAQTNESRDASSRKLLLDPALKEVRVLPQNWSDAEARQFYNTTQGSQMLPYRWYLHLERADSTIPFNSPENIRMFGYLPRDKETSGNPDGLPIGFVKNSDGKGNSYLGLTCAACHTGQINFQGTAWLIDGAPTLADAQVFMRSLEDALRATINDTGKFDRFATAVLTAPASEGAKNGLRAQVTEVLGRRAAYNNRNFSTDAKLANGPGRLDAFDAIFNEVAVRFAQVPNAPTQCDAPVSYPFLWDTPQHDRVQWNGSAENTEVLGQHIGALGRNIGEVLGVFADVDTTNKELPLGGYASSVNIGNLKDLEENLRQLWSPQWPEPAFGKIDTDKVNAGAKLFGVYCATCHQPINRTDPARKVIAQMNNVGTDLSMARNTAERKSSSGIFQGRHVFLPPFDNHKLQGVEPVGLLLAHLGQRVLIGPKAIGKTDEFMFKFDIVADLDNGTTRVATVLKSAEIDAGILRTAAVKSAVLSHKGTGSVLKSGIDLAGVPDKLAKKFQKVVSDVDQVIAKIEGTPEQPIRVIYKYKARPLNGIWATAPYLHNGSVLNLDELLKPAKARLPSFRVGTFEFDPINVGLRNDGPYTFSTTAQPGNSNAGHDDYRDGSGTLKEFSEKERGQLVEYLKTL